MQHVYATFELPRNKCIVWVGHISSYDPRYWNFPLPIFGVPIHTLAIPVFGEKVNLDPRKKTKPSPQFRYGWTDASPTTTPDLPITKETLGTQGLLGCFILFAVWLYQLAPFPKN